MPKFFRISKAHKAAINSALEAVGFAPRLRVFQTCIRVVVDGTESAEARDAIAAALNAAGFRFAGCTPFSRSAVGPNYGSLQTFVYAVVA
jgi:hypothetical protein